MNAKYLKDRMPDHADRAIIIYPDGEKTACVWFGMTREQVANHLYQIADEIVNQLPLPKKLSS
jgi:hypothetical protein